MKPDPPLGRAFLPGGAAEHFRPLMRGLKRLPLTDEGAEFGHLRQNHRHDFQRVELILREFARAFRLHDQHAQPVAQPLQRHAEEGGVDLLPRLRHVAEALLGGRIGGVDELARLGDAADKPFAKAHPRLVNRFRAEALRGAKLQRVVIPEEIDRADLRLEGGGDEARHPVQPFLPRRRKRQGIAKAPQQLAAITLAQVGHRTPVAAQAFSSSKASCSA